MLPQIQRPEYELARNAINSRAACGEPSGSLIPQGRANPGSRETCLIDCHCSLRTSEMALDVNDPLWGPEALSLGPLGSRGSGGCSSFMQAFSKILVHFPLVPAWLCFRCCRKWSARKNFFALLHSPNLCTVVKCSNRRSQSA